MIRWVTAMLSLLCYVGIRRFSGVNRVRGSDRDFIRDGTVEVFMARSKTDVKNSGMEFVLAGTMIGEISVSQLLRKYIRVLGLRQGDYLFPRVSETEVKDRLRFVTYAIAYRGPKMS